MYIDIQQQTGLLINLTSTCTQAMSQNVPTSGTYVIQKSFDDNTKMTTVPTLQAMCHYKSTSHVHLKQIFTWQMLYRSWLIRSCCSIISCVDCHVQLFWRRSAMYNLWLIRCCSSVISCIDCHVSQVFWE